MKSDMGRGPEIGGMQFPIAIPQTLMKYDPPIFAGLEPSSESNSESNNGGGGGGMRPSRGTKGRGDGHAKTSQLDDMVNSMLPPREWTEETGTWMQYASKEPATRLAVIALQVWWRLIRVATCTGDGNHGGTVRLSQTHKSATHLRDSNARPIRHALNCIGLVHIERNVLSDWVSFAKLTQAADVVVLGTM